MNADEIVKALSDDSFCEDCRHYGEPNGCNRGSVCEMYNTAQDAADLIESLRAENEQLKSDLAVMTKLANAKTSCRLNPRTDCAVWQENESLQKQLAEAQRRADAAVRDLNHIANAIANSKQLLDGGEETVACLNLGQCDVCKEACDGSGCRFEWRGPKGEVK